MPFRLPASAEAVEHFCAPSGWPSRVAGSAESADHAAAKAALAVWADRAGLTYVPELRVLVDTDEHLCRVADLGVDTGGGSAWAIEVEYKRATASDWSSKQADYDAAGIGCTWLLGHSRIRATPREGKSQPSQGVMLDSGLVRCSLLVRRLAGLGGPVMALNPHTWQVATLVDSAHPGHLIASGSDVAGLVVEPLEECRFVVGAGFRTPAAMLRAPR